MKSGCFVLLTQIPPCMRVELPFSHSHTRRFVDFAGSERATRLFAAGADAAAAAAAAASPGGATASAAGPLRLQDSGSVNRGLLALCAVVQALAANQVRFVGWSCAELLPLLWSGVALICAELSASSSHVCRGQVECLLCVHLTLHTPHFVL